MWKWFKNIFKKKDKEEFKIIPPKPKMDFSDIKFELNIKSICYFEKLTGKSFYNFTEQDIMPLLYSIFIINNPEKKLTQTSFSFLMEKPEIAEYISKEFIASTNLIYQKRSKPSVGESKEKNSGDGEDITKISDYASSLIIDYGLDANYVMYHMDLWELEFYYTAVESMYKRKMEEERFWTYLKIMPHIDTKKCKSPQAFLPFDWEKETIKKKKQDDLNNNMFAIKNMLGKPLFKKEKDADN